MLIGMELSPAVFHRMTANVSCMAWLPETNAATSTTRRNNTIPNKRRTPPITDTLSLAACGDPSSRPGINPVATAAHASIAACIHTKDESTAELRTWPATSVPAMKATDAEPRTQPYSNPFARRVAALSARASASVVVGASVADCTM